MSVYTKKRRIFDVCVRVGTGYNKKYNTVNQSIATDGFYASAVITNKKIQIL